jgi:hypothetical protein
MTHLLIIGGSDAGISACHVRKFHPGLTVQNCLAHWPVYNLFAARSDL